jgi:hypothetical protein
MLLERTRIVRLGPFEELDLSLCDETGEPRTLTVIHGDGGTGKTSVLTSIAHTRPGKIVPPSQQQRRGGGESYAVCDWRIGAEDEDRPHALRLASPHVKLGGDDSEQLRRREQAHFDRQAAEGPGYAFIEIPGQRYFARATLGLNDPVRAMMRYDVRTSTAGVDATRPDLTRPCKQSIAYAAISSALAGDRRGQQADTRFLGAAMSEAVSTIVELAGYGYRGVEPHSFEPLFESPGGHPVYFDGLPTQVKHLVAFVALPIRVFWAASRGKDPRECEGVVTIDDFELHMGPMLFAALLQALQRALPKAQWILTTGSPYAAAECDSDALLTLRRQPESDVVSIYEGELALTH